VAIPRSTLDDISGESRMKRSGTRLPRVILLSHHPAHYRDPTFLALARSRRFDVRVVQYSASSHNHPYWDLGPNGLQQDVLPAGPSARKAAFLLTRLLRARPDAILLPGSAQPLNLVALWGAWLGRIPFVYSPDTTATTRVRRGFGQGAVDKARRWLHSRAASFWVPGQATRDFLLSEGVPQEKIFLGAYRLDASAVYAEYCGRSGHREHIRAHFGIPRDEWTLLSVGEMKPHRRFLSLVREFRQRFRPGSGVSLLMIGTGEEYTRALQEAEGATNVRLAGSMPLAELASAYAAADVFVHPGFEPYSLALSQAVLCGLPIITTDRVGAAADFVLDGSTGFVVPFDRMEAVVDAIQRTADNKVHARRMGLSGRLAASQMTVDSAALGLEAAFNMALARQE